MTAPIGAQTKREAFLAAMAQVGNITRAAQMVGINRASHYVWMDDPEYAQAFEAACDQAVEVMESEAWRRAMQGVEKPVYQGGKLVGSVQEYSDTLLIFQLKGLRPDKYRDNFSGRIKVETTVHNGGSELDNEIGRLFAEHDSAARLAELGSVEQGSASMEVDG